MTDKKDGKGKSIVPYSGIDGAKGGSLVPAPPPTDPTVAQSQNVAFGDIAGGNINKINTQNVYHGHSFPACSIGDLKERLKLERQHGPEQTQILDQLQRYYRPVSHDGITGLKDKLIRADRGEEVATALDDKEDFAKLLQGWSLYGSAQEIFASFMARAVYSFRVYIKPHLGTATEDQINNLFDEKIVQPILADITGAEFHMSHAAAMGLIYWLADKCYIRWHP